MKTTALAILILLAAARIGHTQSLTLAHQGRPLQNGDHIVLSGPPDTMQLITWLRITNIANMTLRVQMKKEELSMLPGTVSSICWAGYCYGSEMTVSTFPLIMDPMQSDTGCFSHFGPAGQRGTSVVRWTFFHEANPSDSISITAHYATYPAAVEEPSGPEFFLSHAGNNPSGGPVKLRYGLPPGKTGDILLCRPDGRPVAQSGTLTGTGTVEFRPGSLPAGTLLARLRTEGRSDIVLKCIHLH